jgi:hypothetical protein
MTKLESLGTEGEGRDRMPAGKKHRFTAKEDREAEHIKESEMKEGKSGKEAERIGFATVNKRKQPKA